MRFPDRSGCGRWRSSVALTVSVLTAIGLLTGSASSASAKPAYQDSGKPISVRVADLLRRMTTEEKAGQLQQMAVARLQGDCQWSGGELNETCMKEVLADQHAGSILSGGGMTPAENTPEEWAKMTNAVQRYAIENSRLGIPIVYGVDAVHGHNNVLGATMFPHQIGLGATWNRDLIADVARSTQRATAATGTSWNFSPVADLARDHRWGRYYETYSEDPLLAGHLAAGAVEGTEDGSSGRKVASTVKHFAGYSQPLNGHDRSPGDMSTRYLQDTILPPYQQAIDADADTVMVNSGAVNGVPAHTSKYLLTDVLRKRWGFDGVVVSDWDDLEYLVTKYRAAASYPEAIAKAINAGVDMAMLPPDDRSFHESLMTAIKKGLISRKRLNEAAGRVLALKFKLHLFDSPYVDPAQADKIVLGADKQLARQAAAESAVLLRNKNNALPLTRTDRKIVVTGPSANNLPNQLGGWSIGWQGVPEGIEVPGTTVAEGLKKGAPRGTKVSHIADLAKAVQQAPKADAVVVVVGEKPGAEGESDSPRPELAADQQALVRKLQATGTPVIVVVLAGRPLALGKASTPDALLMGWLPGTEGGHAIADVLFGKTNPSGRLPVSWPKELGNDPLFYQQLPGPNSGPESTYHVAYPFGAGLSYTTFETGKPKLNDSVVGPKRKLTVTVPVRNTGKRDGVLIVPVYVAQPASDVLAPDKRLAGYARVALDAGASTDVTVRFPVARLAVTTGDIVGDGPRRVARGDYQVVVGDEKADFTVR